MEALKYIPYLFIILAVGGIVAGATTLSISKFAATTTDAATLGALNNVTLGMRTVAEQFSTIAIIAVMVIIISLLVGLFAYMAYFR